MPQATPLTSEADPGDLVRPVPAKALAQEVIGNRPDPPWQEVNFLQFLGVSLAPGTGEGILALSTLLSLSSIIHQSQRPFSNWAMGIGR